MAYKRTSLKACLAGGLILAVSKIAVAILDIHTCILLQSHFLFSFLVTSEIYYLMWT